MKPLAGLGLAALGVYLLLSPAYDGWGYAFLLISGGLLAVLDAEVRVRSGNQKGGAA